MTMISMPTELTPPVLNKAVGRYYRELQDYTSQADHELTLRPAFQHLLSELARKINLTLVQESDFPALQKALSAFRKWCKDILAFFQFRFQWLCRRQEQPDQSPHAPRLWLSESSARALTDCIGKCLMILYAFPRKDGEPDVALEMHLSRLFPLLPTS